MAKKTITVNNRELMRNYPRLRSKLIYGELDEVIIPMNGEKIRMTLIPKKRPVPGDIRPLLEKLKKMGPKKRFKPIHVDWKWKPL